MSHYSTEYSSDSYSESPNRDAIEFTFSREDAIQIDTSISKLIRIEVKATPEPVCEADFRCLTGLTTEPEISEQKDKAQTKKNYFSFNKLFASKPLHLSKTQAEVIVHSSGNVAIKHIMEFLSSFKKLTALKIVVSDEKTHDLSFLLIASLLEGLKHQLTELYLEFSGCKVSDESLFALADGIQDQSKLKQLQLIFVNSSNESRISDHGIIALTDVLKSCTSIKRVKFEFRNYSKVTNVGLVAFLDNVRGVKSLKELVLNFDGCVITDKALASLGELLMQSPKVKLFGLSLTNLGSMNYASFEKLVEGVKLLKKLKAIHLRLDGDFNEEERMKGEKKMAELEKAVAAINKFIEVGCGN